MKQTQFAQITILISSVKVLLWIYWGAVLVFRGWWGCEGGEGGSPALLLAHLRSGCVINGQSLQISQRVCSVEKSQRRKHVKLRKTRWDFCWEEKYNPMSLFYCTGRDQMALCYDWALLVILSSCSQRRSDDSFRDRGSEMMWLSARLYREHKLSVNLSLRPQLLLFWIVVWAATGNKSDL